MTSASSHVKRARKLHRQPLRNLTYVALDEGNGGIVRNLSHAGIAVQTVAPLQPGQQVRVRFELRQPRIPIEVRGEVLWAHASGRSGIRFIDLPAKKVRQLNEWIFGNLLECIPAQSQPSGSLFKMKMPGEAIAPEPAGSPVMSSVGETVAMNAEKTRALSSSFRAKPGAPLVARAFDLDWLTRPLSGPALALAIDTLVVFAAVLVFFLVFVSVSSELPEWPLNLGLGLATAIFVAAFYWGFFQTLAGTTLGASLARLAGNDSDAAAEREKSARFR